MLPLPTIEQLYLRLRNLEAQVATMKAPGLHFDTYGVALTPPADGQAPLWVGNRLKYIPTTLVPGTGLPAWATATPATVAAAGVVGTGTTIVRPDHGHPHGSGYLVDAHHIQLHQAAHNNAGGDALKLDDLATPDDNTDLNASTTAHGLLLKRDGLTTTFLRGDGTWAAPAGGVMDRAGLYLPGRFTTPADATISANTTLTNRFNYYKNLTINAGVTLTGIAGGTIVVVEETFTLTGILSGDALGGRGGPASAVNGAGQGGYGGGFFGANSATALTFTQQAFISSTAISASNPYMFALFNILQGNMAAGGGGAGAAWGSVTDSPFSSTLDWISDYSLFLALLQGIIFGRNTDDATAGGIGGGGGASGAAGQTAGADGAGGVDGSRGNNGATTKAAGGGGSGFGAGGSGGVGPTTQNLGASGVGGRGGSPIIVICRAITGPGSITSNGGNGVAGTLRHGGSAGAGAGAVAVLYESGTVPTLTAAGGTGTAGSGAGTTAGSDGGAGLTLSVQISVAA